MNKLSLNIILIFIANFAQADEFHYLNSMIGERASGLGGAFISLSDDPSGIYHNPAGILFNFDDSFTLTANVFNSSELIFNDIAPGKDYTYKSSGMLSNFFGVTQNWGKHKIGFGIIYPMTENFDQDDSIDNVSATTGGPKQFRRKFFRNNSVTLIGGSIATEPIKDLSVGASLFLGQHRDKAIDHQYIAFNPDSGGAERFFLRHTTKDYHVDYLYPKFGLQWMPLPKWSLGAVIAKKISTYSKMQIKSISTQVDETTQLPIDNTGNISNDLSFTNTVIRPDELSPIEMGAGISYFPTKTFLVTADITYNSADENYIIAQNVRVINFAGGIEHYLSEDQILRFGIFTNMANTPQLKDGFKNQNPHVDLYGSSASFSFIGPNSSTTFGMAFSKGEGKGQGIGDSTTIHDVIQTGLNTYVVFSSQM